MMHLSDAVLAEDLRCLADSGPLDGPTRHVLEQAADRLERLAALLDACDENERHIRANVPHLPPDGGSFSVHVIRRYLSATAEQAR